MSLEELFTSFKQDVYDRGDEIDPDDSYEWDALAYGFALGKGASRLDAATLSIYWSKFCTGRWTIEKVIENRCTEEDE